MSETTNSDGFCVRCKSRIGFHLDTCINEPLIRTFCQICKCWNGFHRAHCENFKASPVVAVRTGDCPCGQGSQWGECEYHR